MRHFEKHEDHIGMRVVGGPMILSRTSLLLMGRYTTTSRVLCVCACVCVCVCVRVATRMDLWYTPTRFAIGSNGMYSRGRIVLGCQTLCQFLLRGICDGKSRFHVIQDYTHSLIHCGNNHGSRTTDTVTGSEMRTLLVVVGVWWPIH